MNRNWYDPNNLSNANNEFRPNENDPDESNYNYIETLSQR